MSRRRAGYIIFADILLLTSLITLYFLDQMINGTLYNFGLIFDAGWSQPYNLLSRLTLILVITAILTISSVELPISAFKEKE